MTSNVAKLAPRGSHAELPHLPPIALDVTDDIRELLQSFGAKQAGQSDICYADLCEGMAAALRTASVEESQAFHPQAEPVSCPVKIEEPAYPGVTGLVAVRDYRLLPYCPVTIQTTEDSCQRKCPAAVRMPGTATGRCSRKNSGG